MTGRYEYEPCTNAIATVRGVSGVHVMVDEEGDWHAVRLLAEGVNPEADQ